MLILFCIGKAFIKMTVLYSETYASFGSIGHQKASIPNRVPFHCKGGRDYVVCMWGKRVHKLWWWHNFLNVICSWLNRTMQQNVKENQCWMRVQLQRLQLYHHLHHLILQLKIKMTQYQVEYNLCFKILQWFCRLCLTLWIQESILEMSFINLFYKHFERFFT